ncbi:hypothetical protein H0H81_010022 [Sphagnurus paluster]|uniref:Uncharacterized protein n=1 Tax=Sphagnurus paluster TaxID=117069 RepID=A0A9P7FYR3_9AGAR|nr:hypothetical protein H0H81_010022 [Sphagnurus paluster]
MRRVVDDDPLTLAIAPPPNETAEERLAREELEERARQVSKRIDAEIKLAKVAMKKKQKAVKVLVVGQSLSDFQMTYAQRSWAEERESWKAVILLNLARSVNTVIDVLVQELNNMQTTYMNEGTTSRVSVIGLGERHKSLTLKLAPLRQIERDLISLLGAGSYETQDAPKTPSRKEGRNVLHEFALRSTTGWKAVLDHVRNPTGGRDQQLQRVAGDVIASCKDDIQQLWGDVLVQQMLQKHNIRLEDAPGLYVCSPLGSDLTDFYSLPLLKSFLDDVKRIATREYIPTDADVVRARLRTTGVQEYHFTLDRGALTALDWWMYDVAG